ncbi:hypothetical protein D3C76_1515220 [compost metagenome]
MAHNGAAHGKHLLFPAGQRSGLLLLALKQPREHAVDPLEIGGKTFAVLQVSSELKILFH